VATVLISIPNKVGGHNTGRFLYFKKWAGTCQTVRPLIYARRNAQQRKIAVFPISRRNEHRCR